MAKPMTTKGKERSKYNSLKGGLYIQHILPCTEVCVYKDICPVYKMLVDGYENQPFITTCTLEAAQYLRLKEYYYNNPKYIEIDKGLIEMLIYFEIRIDRTRRYISIHSDMTTSSKRLSKAYILLSRYQRKYVQLIELVLDMISSDFENR